MESTYSLGSGYLPVQSTHASYTKELFAPEGPLQAALLLTRITTRLDHARQAYEALAYGNRKCRQRAKLSRQDQDSATEAFYHYKEMLDAYYTLTLALRTEGGVVKPKHSLVESCHERLLSFLQNLLLAWVERLAAKGPSWE